MKRNRFQRSATLLTALAGLSLWGCESDSLAPMNRPLSRDDAMRADEEMRSSAEQMLEESESRSRERESRSDR